MSLTRGRYGARGSVFGHCVSSCLTRFRDGSFSNTGLHQTSGDDKDGQCTGIGSGSGKWKPGVHFSLCFFCFTDLCLVYEASWGLYTRPDRNSRRGCLAGSICEIRTQDVRSTVILLIDGVSRLYSSFIHL